MDISGNNVQMCLFSPIHFSRPSHSCPKNASALSRCAPSSHPIHGFTRSSGVRSRQYTCHVAMPAMRPVSTSTHLKVCSMARPFQYSRVPSAWTLRKASSSTSVPG